MVSEKEFLALKKELKEMKEKYCQKGTWAGKFKAKAIKTREIAQKKGEITVTQIMDEFDVSRPYALRIIRKAANNSDSMLYFPGNVRKPTKLVFEDSADKTELVFSNILINCPVDIGEHLSFKKLKKEHNLSKKGIQKLRSLLVSTGRFVCNQNNFSKAKRVR